MCGLLIFRPCRSLDAYIRYYWILRSREELSTLTFTVGCPQLIFHRNRSLYISELRTHQPQFAISGQVNFPATLQSTDDTEMIVVVLKPHAATLFDIPISAFYNHEIDGFDLGYSDLNDLARRVFDAECAEDGIRIIEQWLISRLNEKRIYDFTRIGVSLSMLFSDCKTTVRDMAYATCLGKRQFERVFFNSVGMKPKEYARIVRFQKSLWFMQTGNHDYMDIAFNSGYSDQSHFIRECREYSGLTPSKLIVTQPIYSDLFSSPV